MTEFSLYLVILCSLVALFCAIGIWRFVSNRSVRKNENKFLNSVLADAIRQGASVDLKLLGEGVRSGLQASIVGSSKKGLVMLVGVVVSKDWEGKSVEAYFRVEHTEGPVFFVFESTVLAMRSNGEKTQIELAMPQHLRVEQKRHFIRAQPDLQDILMLAVWPMSPGKRLPRGNAELGTPIISYKAGQDKPRVRVENISGSGLALCFPMPVDDSLAGDSRKGRQLMCLLVYRPEPNAPKPVVFWCTAEIMNVRKSDASLAMGLEFTNWAIQEQGDTEIHWAHNSPWRGVKPILQWVQRIDKAQNAKGG